MVFLPLPARSLRAARLLLLALAAAVFPARAQERVQLNQVTAVEVREGEVRILGTRRPNFTSFTLTSPPRLVLDISEALFKGVPAQQKGSGEITGVRTAAYGSEASAIARVLIGFTREVETDIQVDADNALVVRVTGGGVGLVAVNDGARDAVAAQKVEAEEARARAEAERAAQARDAEAARAGAEVARVEQEKAAAEARARAESERAELERVQAEQARKAEEIRRQAEEARAAAEAEKARKAEEARAAAEAEKARKAEEARAAAEEKRRQAEEARAAAEAEKARKAEEARAAAEERRRKAEEARAAAEAEKARKAEEARAAAEAEKARKAEEARAAAEEKARKAEEARAAAEEKRRKAEEARAAAGAEKARKAEEAEREARAARTRAAVEAEEARQRKLEQARAAAEAERQARAERTRAAVEAEEARVHAAQGHGRAGRRVLEFIGFSQQASASRVYVRTNAPATYDVGEEGSGKVIVTLEDTSIGMANNQRTLDTSFFETAVTRVQALPGPGHTVRLEISLRRAVPYTASQQGNEIRVDFERAGRP